MKAILLFLVDHFSDLLDLNFTVNIVILFVICVRQFLKGAPKIFSYALWGVVLLRLLVPVSIESPVSFVPERTEFSSMVEVNEVLPEIQFETPLDRADNEWRQENTAPGEPLVQTYRTADAETYLTIVWLLGIAGMLLYSMVSYLKLRRRVSAAAPLRKGIYVADHIDTPFVMGLFRPAIYLPSTLGPWERQYIIAHERHHIRRGDHIFKALGFLALTIHWFNPLVWLAFSLASRDMEMSCDEAVIRRLGEDVRADYSETLLNLATGRRLFAGTPLAFGEDDPVGRVRNLAKWKKPAIWVTVICVLVCAVLAICLLTDPEAADQDIQPSLQASGTIVSNPVQQENKDPIDTCKMAIENLENVESYYIVMEYECSGMTGKEEYFRHGMDFLRRGTNALQGDAVFFNGNYSFQKGNEWNHSSGADVFDPNGWLELWSPEGKNISNLQTDGNQISFDAVWSGTAPGYDSCEGMFTYEFDEAGSLISITKEYAMLRYGEVSVTTKQQLTPMVHEAKQVYETIKTVAGQYSLHYDDGGVSISAERVSRTGATAIFVHRGNLLGKDIAELTYGDFLSLERFENGKWVEVEELPGYEYYVGDASYPVVDGYGMVHEWEDRFGELPDGHYRLGKLVTVKYTDGTSEQCILHAEFLLPDSVLTGPLPLEDLPEKYGAEQAMIDGCFVQTDGVARENKELFRQFADLTQSGTPSFIRIVNWYYGDDPHYDAYDLEYDGSIYTISWIADGQRYSREYRNLKHFTGGKERDNVAYDAYEHYVLVNDNTLTWQDIWENLISASTPTPIDHMTVYSNYTYLPKKPQIPENLAQAVLEFEGEKMVETTDFDRLEKLYLLFDSAELLGYEPKTHSIGVGLNLILTTKDGETLTVELDPDNDLCRIDGEYVFYGAFDEPNYIEKLCYYLGLEAWPDAVYERYPNAFRP